MGMAMKRHVVSVEVCLELAGIVHDEDSPPGPAKLERWIGQLHAELRGCVLERLTLAVIVVAEHSGERRLKLGEGAQGLGLSDVSRMDDPLDACLREQLDDASHVREVIVRVADDADAHSW